MAKFCVLWIGSIITRTERKVMRFSYFCPDLQIYSLKFTVYYDNMPLTPPGLIQGWHSFQCILTTLRTPNLRFIPWPRHLGLRIFLNLTQSHNTPWFTKLPMYPLSFYCLPRTKSPIPSNPSLNFPFIMF